MKHEFPKDDQTRFSGRVRHYHRSGPPARPSWDEWVDGTAAKKGSFLKYLKIVGVVLAILALGGIVAGLIIELR